MGARVSYEAVLCDVDGVVRHWGNSMSEVDAQFGLASGTLASIAFDPVRLTPAITGAVSDEAWRTAVADELGRTCGDKQNGRDAVATWSAMTGSVDGDVVELLRAARDHTRVVLVSNATTRLEHDMAALGVLDAVDDVVNSSSVGVAKPDEKIYRVAAERAGTSVERCVFVDDVLDNVVAAQQLGMTGVHFETSADLANALSSR